MGSDLERQPEERSCPRGVIRRRLELHSPLQNLLVIETGLMSRARDATGYRAVRDRLVERIAGDRLDSATVARVLRYLSAELAPIRWEPREVLVATIFERTGDAQALVLFLVSMSEMPDATRPILDRILMRPDRFPLLRLLLASPLLGAYRAVLTEKLLEGARLHRRSLHRWALRDREGFFHPAVFRPLFRGGAALIGAITTEILARGPAPDRQRLVERLVRTGSERALRLLVLGLGACPGPLPRVLIRALGRFDHPLALSMLREVVHRANTGAVRVPECAAAIRALRRSPDPEAERFLREIRGNRKPGFRRRLRRIASRG